MTKRARVPARKERVLLSDVLPFETPPIFDNEQFYTFLVENDVDLANGSIVWNRGDSTVDAWVKAIFGFRPNCVGEVLSSTRQSLKVRLDNYTIPFEFRTRRADGDFRALAVCHPRHQFGMVHFYSNHESAMLYYTSQSSFSLRHPTRVSRYEYLVARLHAKLKRSWARRIETDRKPLRSLRSYFVYRDFGNIYKFYESREYQELEKRFSHLLKLDISKCFATIYTHSAAWAVYGKANTKENLSGRRKAQTFAEAFDQTMQRLNYNETNGIVVGPEFSRVFAEVILQRVDREVEAVLLSQHQLRHGHEYEIRRYVDDYFVFVDDSALKIVISDVVKVELSKYHLHLNPLKELESTTPGITPISIAKLRLGDAVGQHLKPGIAKKSRGRVKYRTSPGRIDATRLTSTYKTILKETGVDPAGVLNYTLSIVERRLVQMLSRYAKTSGSFRAQRKLTERIVETLAFAFFIYSTSPRVNPTVKVSRICTHIINFLHNQRFDGDLTRLILDRVRSEIVSQLERNKPTEHVQVENLYLLTALSQLGREYLVEEDDLMTYFEISATKRGTYEFAVPLNHFSLTTLLHYVEGRSRYARIRAAAEQRIVELVRELNDVSAERLFLLVDSIAAPNISAATKTKLFESMGITDMATRTQMAANPPLAFTHWRKFDLGEALDSKRHQEVY